MIVISGVPRSGTSVMTNIMLELLGEDRLIGSKFMGNDKVKEIAEGPMPEPIPIHKYLRKKKIETMQEKARKRLQIPTKVQERRNKRKKKLESMKEMNPNGFYECQFTVQGLYWRPQVHGLFAKIEAMEKEPFCKIVSNGLLKSDPTRISKIVYMLRDPREVAKSQEKLKRPKTMPMPEGEKFHSPDFFITATVQFCRWAVQYASEVEVLMVHHGDLLSDPEPQVQRVAEFLSVEPGNAHSVVDKKLHRSKPQPIPHPQWGDAEAIYDLMKKSDYQGVLDYMKDPTRETHKQHTSFLCHRMGSQVMVNQCKVCRKKKDVVENFIKTAERRKIDWKNEPCAFECGAIPGEEIKTIEDSIKENHWVISS